MNRSDCPFCHLDPARVFFESELVVGLWDGFPVNPGHALLVPRRHVPSWFETTQEEKLALLAAIDAARDEILSRHQPDGFNIGVNVGAAAGQSVFHLHVHVIPRYRGDVPKPRGGVRHVIPARGDYGTEPEAPPSAPAMPGGLVTESREARLVTGGDDHLLPHLLENLDRAKHVDIAVAFIMASGVQKVVERFAEVLDRGGRMRILTGDYLLATDPNALLRLLDLGERTGARERLALRVFEARNTSFHPKVYVFRDGADDGIAFVGSSNLSARALTDGIEWNYRVVSSRDATAYNQVSREFESLFTHPATTLLTSEWVEAYRQRRVLAFPRGAGQAVATPAASDEPVGLAGIAAEDHEPLPPAEPHDIQSEALTALAATRAEGNRAGLVVMATGLGKTWLSAFDLVQSGCRRALFVAHREEILSQALDTFRRIRPEARLGCYTGKEKDPAAEILFASVQTLGRRRHLDRFDAEEFDYIVIDEFHHAMAATYRRIIDHFEPRFLLGLTATPERTDGGDLLQLCQENLVYRCDVVAAIKRGFLAPYHYYGVPDEVDYQNIPWRSNCFDEAELTEAVATQARAKNALEQHRRRAGERTLAFCVSQRHADFMAEFFREAGVEAVAVHAGVSSAPRITSLEKLGDGSLAVLFAVDMFNEGVDVPQIDTVMMLRPTESRILWIQQFGRGLRKADGKSHLTVIDYIGNHRCFLLKVQTLLNLQAGDGYVKVALERARRRELGLPLGCEVTYDLEVTNILRALLRVPKSEEALRSYCEDYRDRLGERPRAHQAFHDGYNPRAARKIAGSWFGFLKMAGFLGKQEMAAYEAVHGLLDTLESTPMTRSYKMITLFAMLALDQFPGEVSLDRLTTAFARIARRSRRLATDVGLDLNDPGKLKRLITRNPVAAWVGGKGTGGRPYFALEGETFSTRLGEIPDRLRGAVRDLVRELAEWRQAEYLQREPSSGEPVGFPCRVSHANGRPIIFLPDRTVHPDLAEGWVDVVVGDETHQANFVKIAINVVRRIGSDENILPEILRRWFGLDAGKPGTVHSVVLQPDGQGGYRLVRGGEGGGSRSAVPGEYYARREIPPLFGLEWTQGQWGQQGFISRPGHLFLLVTLRKSGKPAEYQYEDRFLDRECFHWQSQNQTTQAGKHGQQIRSHRELGYAVHLFVRRDRLFEGKAAKYVYCGDLDFEQWEGEKPISVTWRLRSPLSQRMLDHFRDA